MTAPDPVEMFRAAKAEEIRAELVCCSIYDTGEPREAERAGHGLCYWGEAGARLVEGRPDVPCRHEDFTVVIDVEDSTDGFEWRACNRCNEAFTS